MMHQRIPDLPKEVPVSNLINHGGRVRYVGTARLMPNGKYLALAECEGSLVRMEMELSFPQLARPDVTW